MLRKVRTLISAALVLCLVAPAVADCCVSAGTAMPCCADKRTETRVLPTCCVQNGQPQQTTPSSTVFRLARIDPPAVVGHDVHASALSFTPRTLSIEHPSDPPGTERLYLRLSVIRR